MSHEYFNVKLSMDEKTVFSFYNESVVCVQFIAESLVNLDKRNTNKEIVWIKNYQPFLYICILALVLQIYPYFLKNYKQLYFDDLILFLTYSTLSL